MFIMKARHCLWISRPGFWRFFRNSTKSLDTWSVSKLAWRLMDGLGDLPSWDSVAEVRKNNTLGKVFEMFWITPTAQFLLILRVVPNMRGSLYSPWVTALLCSSALSQTMTFSDSLWVWQMLHPQRWTFSAKWKGKSWILQIFLASIASSALPFCKLWDEISCYNKTTALWMPHLFWEVCVMKGWRTS